MNAVLRTLRTAAIATAGAAYLAFGYVAAVSEQASYAMLVVVLAPLVALAFGAAWQARARWPATLLCAGALALAVLHAERLRDHVAMIYFVQHVGAMGLLGLTFGSTLRGSHADALCSRIAALVIPGPLDGGYLRYTWQVTLAWTLFFALTGALSVLLFCFGPIAWWSLLANVLTPVMVGAMFAGEYLIRLRTMPDRPHMSIAATIEAYRAHRRA